MGFLFQSTQKISNSENRIGALRVQSSTQGLPIPVVYGTTRVSPNVIWYGDFTAIANTQSSQQGGKGGGGVEVTNTSYTYTVAVALALLHGPLAASVETVIPQIWSNKDLTSMGGLGMSYFTGSLNQGTWSHLDTNHPAESLNYPSVAYVAHEAFPLGGSDSLPNLSFEVRGLLNTSNTSTVTACTPDENPGLVAQDLLTSPVYGLPLAPTLDVNGFIEYCYASNFLCSPAYIAQRPAADILSELTQIGNSAIVWTGANVLKVIPYGDLPVSYQGFEPGGGPNPDCCVPGSVYTFTPDLAPAYNLELDDFIAQPGTPPVRVYRKRQSDSFNLIQVECLDRSNSYNIYVAEARDQAAVEQYGIKAKDVITLHAVCDPAIARSVAQTILQRELYIRNTYEFSLGYRFSRLEPMDIVTLTEPGIGAVNKLVRINTLDESPEGLLKVTAEELTVGVSTPGDYATQGTGGFVVDNSVAPGQTNAPVIFQPPIEISGIPQIWIGASGGENWGGAQIWASDDDASYSQVGVITNPARYGVITNNFPAHFDPDTTNNLSVNLTLSRGNLSTATIAQADAGDTLTYLDGELIAYTDATLTSPYNYTLSGYIRRGRRCTIAAAHTVGADVMRLDGAVQRINISESRVGSTVYIKLLSFNKNGSGLLALDDVTPIPYVVQPVGVVVTGGAIPSTIAADQVLCIPPAAQYTVLGRLTCNGRINCDGTLIIT